MNAKLLIDAVIRQTMVLIAQLATTAGLRAPLAHVADQVFRDLSAELESQGVGRKVIADMFGLHLRSYQLKVQRLAESATDRDGSLWQGVFEFLRENDVVPRGAVLARFYNDDEAKIRGILHDLVENGLVFKTGRGHKTSYRAATDKELDEIFARDTAETARWLVWMCVYHHGPIGPGDVADILQAEPDVVAEALADLVSDGRVDETIDGSETIYRCDLCVVPMDEPHGWEAAIYDHFNAIVSTVCTKLRQQKLRTLPGDAIGGSTYSFDVWDDHPYEERVMALLRETRERLSDLREEVTDYNTQNGWPEDARTVTFYIGQTIRDPHEFDEVVEESDGPSSD